MFTGIIEAKGRILSLREEGGRVFEIEAPFASGLAVGESVAVNGVCLTATAVGPASFTCFASRETLGVSALGRLGVGDAVNLERAMRLGDRLSGHIVQGHVDGRAILEEASEASGSRLLRFRFENPEGTRYLVPKGSVAVEGVSLTVYEKRADGFVVMIIPHTWEVTVLGGLVPGSPVNVEFDVLAKHVEALLSPHP